MMVVGVTGAIASGKSFIAEYFSQKGILVYDADTQVHKLWESSEELRAFTEKNCSEAVTETGVNRAAIAQLVFNDIKLLRSVEKVIHPIIREQVEAFIKDSKDQGALFVVLDIPLLFEAGFEVFCDKIILASSKQEIRYERADKIKHKNSETVDLIDNLQMEFDEKSNKVDYIVDCSGSKNEVYEQLSSVLNDLRGIQ